MNTVAEAVNGLLALMVAGEWAGLERMTSGSPVSADELRDALAEYGQTLVMPPFDAFDELDPVELGGSINRTLSVRVRLWTLEQSQSDLELSLNLSEVADGLWSVHIVGLRLL